MSGILPTSPAFQALLRHFTDLRDGRHGGCANRHDKEQLFRREILRLDPVVREVFAELNTALLLRTGVVEFNAVQRDTSGGLVASWTLSWPEQEHAGLPPVMLLGVSGWGFHHPHLRAATVGEWPLNVYSDEQAWAERDVLRAIVAGELHNLVFQLGGNIRLIPALGSGLENR
ncbi:hypothetical protein [Deinococcus sp. QL22]|uniref:hypothetical protein n=1 Tax=Deinococcus sp. QL22 TaxID=2939437 RepID=UPI002016AF27|nr:hypothetical protein [Deinococcus sp. QL22]UQN07982.1 hypothetical protein M1R55_17955 [Deinococcus sp. QL22]